MVFLKKQLPIETNGETSKLLQGTLNKTCFAGEKILRSSECVADKKKKNPADYLTLKFDFLFLTDFSNDNVCELQNAECLRKATITLTTLLVPSS